MRRIHVAGSIYIKDSYITAIKIRMLDRCRITFCPPDLLGETIYEGSVDEGSNELFFLNTKPGMYIIRVSDGVNSSQVRMIKE